LGTPKPHEVVGRGRYRDGALAKDAAAVQNIAAGEAMEASILAIESGASRGLRTLGLFVDFQREAQIAELQFRRALTETEEKQIRYNAVMREGAKIQSPYARTMMATLTNRSARSGYIPNDAAFAMNTFEVVSSRLQPGCAESSIVNGILDLMQ
jgi:hypothetical protein